jgi:ribonuclease HI
VDTLVSSNLPVTTRFQAWQKPPLGWIKVNTDESFISTSSRAGAEMVARDENTRVIAIACFSPEPCEDAEEAEARAALAGLTHCTNLGFRKIILEIDSASTVGSLTKDQQIDQGCGGFMRKPRRSYTSSKTPR